jgi:hypothetical protein
MKLTAGTTLTLDQLAYVASLEDELERGTRGLLKAERRRTEEARAVAGRLRRENTRLRNLIRTQETTSA